MTAGGGWEGSKAQPAQRQYRVALAEARPRDLELSSESIIGLPRGIWCWHADWGILSPFERLGRGGYAAAKVSGRCSFSQLLGACSSQFEGHCLPSKGCSPPWREGSRAVLTAETGTALNPGSQPQTDRISEPTRGAQQSGKERGRVVKLDGPNQFPIPPLLRWLSRAPLAGDGLQHIFSTCCRCWRTSAAVSQGTTWARKELGSAFCASWMRRCMG